MTRIKPLHLLLLVGVVLALGACATTQPTGVTADPNIALPATFENVWYRTGKVRLFGLAYEASGRLTVREDSLVFSHDGGTVTIPTRTIEKVTWGKLSPDITNDWVIVHVSGSEPGALAAFKGAVLSGGDESRLYSAVLRSSGKR